MITYEKILDDVETYSVISTIKFIVENPLSYFRSKNIGFIEKFQLIMNYILFLGHNRTTIYYIKSIPSLILKKHHIASLQAFPEKERFLNPVVKYLIKTHIRRQLVKLHKFYLREIFTQNNLKNKEDVEELRKIDIIIKEYIQELPNIKRFFSTTAGILLGVITLAQFFGFNSLVLKESFININSLAIIVTIATISTLYIISEVFVSAFRIKRHKFLNTFHIYPCYDLYFGKGKEIYEKSVYKIEDLLYEGLGKRNQKPKEIPIDKILQLVLPGSFTLFLLGTTIVGIATSPITKIEVPWDAISVGLPILSLMVFAFFVMPLLKYRRRKKNLLL